MTNYEITYIISPAIDEAAKTALVERFDNILKNDGAEIVDSKDWSKRRFDTKLVVSVKVFTTL